MKEFLSYMFAASIVVMFVAAIVYGLRVFNTAATPLIVHEAEPGVHCASMTTTHGIAIDCWKVRGE